MSSELTTLGDLLMRSDFLVALAAGVIALAVFFLLEAEKGLPGWALALVTASLLAVSLTIGRRLGLIAALAALGMGGWLLGNDDIAPTDLRRIIAWVALGAGALGLATRTGLEDVTWIIALVPLSALVGGLGLRTWARSDARRLLGPLFAITAFGIWTTVPDTEEARALLGASLPLALATTRRVDARIASAGAFVLAGFVAWVAATGGAGREASIIGALGSLGVLVLIPAAEAIAQRQIDLRSSAVVIGHSAIVLVSARVIGLWEEAIPATAAMVVLVAVALTALWVMSSKVTQIPTGPTDP